MADSKYRPWFPELACWMARNGLTADQMATEFNVEKRTLYRWRTKHPELAEAMDEGRDLADARVEDSLYQAAISGNVTAIIFWLKNRRPNSWRDVQRHEHTGKDGKPIEVENAREALISEVEEFLREQSLEG